MKNNILFYSSVSSKLLFKTQKFYQVDIQILEELGYNVILSNRIIDALFFWKYDLVFAYFYRWSFFVSLIALFFGRVTYFTGGIDNLDRDYAAKKDFIIQTIFMRLCYIVAKSCIIVSQSDLKNVRYALSGFSCSKLSYSEHTIDVGKYVIDSVHKELLFATIVWQGDVENVKRKGVDVSLKIFSLLKRTPGYNNARFVIIGKKGAGTSYLEDIVVKEGLSDSVYFTNEISEEEKISYLYRSKYYFQLSLYEGFGLAALEALRMKNVVIHSKKGGLSNPIFENGIFYDIDDDMSKSFKNLCSDLNSFDYCKLDNIYFQLGYYYGNERRKDDFKRILCV